jgi:hypothetical protein
MKTNFEKNILVIALVILAIVMISGFCYQEGYQTGIAYQKEQPVDIAVSWYNATENTASFDVYTLMDTGQISIHPEKDITEYNIQKSHVDDP